MEALTRRYPFAFLITLVGGLSLDLAPLTRSLQNKYEKEGSKNGRIQRSVGLSDGNSAIELIGV